LTIWAISSTIFYKNTKKFKFVCSIHYFELCTQHTCVTSPWQPVLGLPRKLSCSTMCHQWVSCAKSLQWAADRMRNIQQQLVSGTPLTQRTACSWKPKVKSSYRWIHLPFAPLSHAMWNCSKTTIMNTITIKWVLGSIYNITFITRF
jgi:hypothetical protein